MGKEQMTHDAAARVANAAASDPSSKTAKDGFEQRAGDAANRNMSGMNAGGKGAGGKVGSMGGPGKQSGSKK